MSRRIPTTILALFLLPALAGCLTLSAEGGGSKNRATRHRIGTSSDADVNASSGRRQSVAHAMEGGTAVAAQQAPDPQSKPKPGAKSAAMGVVALRPLASRTPLPSPTTIPTTIPTIPPTSTPEPLADAGPPVRVAIPAIGVDAEVEYVGLTPDRAMDVPKGWMNVGWYRNGFLPGELGNSVIAGHLDSSTGGPAVFWDLNKLVPGDEIVVTFENGSQRRFSVEADKVYDHDAEGPIIDSIFGKSLTADLNLVTCDGAWDHGAATYTKRLVVFATLISE